MKRKYILQHIAALLLTFLAFAFVQAEINPFKWCAGVRAFMLVVNGGVQFLVIVNRLGIDAQNKI